MLLSVRHTAAVLPLMLCFGCAGVQKAIVPSNYRNWAPEHSQLATADFSGDTVTIHNVRQCRWIDKDVFVPSYEQRTYRMSDLVGVDFFMIPFETMPAIAHTMLSFEFRPPDAPPEYLSVSVEIRCEEGEEYAAWKGSFRQYELIYVVADERDAVAYRADAWKSDVYLYRTEATPEMTRRLFVDVMGRANELASRPEFYDTLTNNCTTNIARHVNRIKPNRLKYDYHVLLPGLSDKLAYDEGLIRHDGTFEETKRKAYITGKVLANADSKQFSEIIRR